VTDECDKRAAREQDAAVAVARPQFVAVRGGSLGFAPPANNRGLLAGVAVKQSGGSNLSSKSSADAFAKVGGVTVGPVTAELNGESFEEEVPRVSLTDASSRPAMTLTTFASVGFRARWNLHPTVWATHRISDDCVQGVAENPNKEHVEHCNDDEVSALTQSAVWSLMAGLRVVRRGTADEGLTDLSSVQWEFGLRRDSEAQAKSRFSWSIMGGLSGMHFNRSDVTDSAGTATTRYLQMNDVRLSFAAEIRRAASKDEATSVAIGLYGVAARNSWTNTFEHGESRKVRDHQLEGGVYLSGAMTGFSGLVMLSVIQPYTPGAPYIYAVSVVPFGGGTPTSGTGPNP
jgi:hypothetical protein